MGVNCFDMARFVAVFSRFLKMYFNSVWFDLFCVISCVLGLFDAALLRPFHRAKDFHCSLLSFSAAFASIARVSLSPFSVSEDCLQIECKNMLILYLIHLFGSHNCFFVFLVMHRCMHE